MFTHVLKLILKTYMALLYPFLMTDDEIKINFLVFRFTSPLILKEIHSFNKVTILKDINKKESVEQKDI